MNLLPSNQIPAVSSIEIAELTGKEHFNVMRDIRKTLEAAGIGPLKFESSYINAQNKEQPCFLLPRFECDLVVSGYSVPYRAAIIKRWHELEADRKASAITNRKDDLLRELITISNGEVSADLLNLMRPRGAFGEVGKNGLPKTGFRASAWVASAKSRLEEAAEINKGLRQIAQLELALGCLGEEVA